MECAEVEVDACIGLVRGDAFQLAGAEPGAI
jgi:hypothetical protein